MTTTEQIDSIAPGQAIRCTVTKIPRAKAPRDTIARLMRLDPANVKSLKRAQHLRRKRMLTYIRGNRVWYSREKSARIVRVSDGATWNMEMIPTLTPDLKSVADYLQIDKA